MPSTQANPLLAASVFDVQDKVVLITGAGSGMGKAMSLVLSANGAKVFAVGRRLDPLEALVKEAQANGGGKIIPIQGDVSTLDGVKAIVEKVAGMTDRLDVLVNNAGLGGTALKKGKPENDPAQVQQTLLSADWDEFGTLSDVNLAGPYFLTAHFVSLLAKSASPSVIFNASTLGMSKTSPAAPAYDATKAGILQIAHTLAGRLIPLNIRVNSILTYFYPSEMMPIDSQATDPWTVEQLSMIPAGRFGEIQNLAGTILFLASKASEYSNGLNITLDGGWLLTESAAKYLPDKKKEEVVVNGNGNGKSD